MFVKNLSLKNDDGSGNSLTVRKTRLSMVNYIRCEFPGTEWFKKTTSYLGPKNWEILPTRLKLLDDHVVFMKELKDYYVKLFSEEGFV